MPAIPAHAPCGHISTLYNNENTTIILHAPQLFNIARLFYAVLMSPPL